jgi:SAM-dependent methyltransferase
MDAVELGCGTGYVSSFLARLGAKVVGIDPSTGQLATARRLTAEHELDVEFVQGIAENVPYPDESFDFAVSEYGAATWSDPGLWIPEAWRLLRPGGRLVFLGAHPLVALVAGFSDDEPVTRTLMNPYFGMYRMDWDDGEGEGTEFNMPISGWIALFDRVGFDVETYHELQAPRPGTDNPGAAWMTYDWGHEYPAEQVWKLRKRLRWGPPEHHQIRSTSLSINAPAHNGTDALGHLMPATESAERCLDRAAR